MRDIAVTVVGNVGGEPTLRFTEAGNPVTSFTLGSTPRAFDKQLGKWVDGETTWFRITCWRGLAQNVAECVKKGQRVLVNGRLRISNYIDKDGINRSVTELIAEHIGHDLTFGTSYFKKNTAGAAAAEPGVPGSAGVGSGAPVLTQQTSDGNPVGGQDFAGFGGYEPNNSGSARQAHVDNGSVPAVLVAA